MTESQDTPDDRWGAKGLNARPATPSQLYEEHYYLTSCEGHECFNLGSRGYAVSPRLEAALKLARPTAGERILDIGCGRGEASVHCAQQGALACGLDYSAGALRIVQQVLAASEDEATARIRIMQADAKNLPFGEASFDKVLMFDLLEHLYPWELAQALREAYRVLVCGGRLIIHTAPNRWYYRFGYPLYRLFERLRGRRLPSDPRDRFAFHHLHVNEQDILSLRRSLGRAGFRAEVWLDSVERPLVAEPSRVFGRLIDCVVTILLEMYPFRWVFRNDIFSIGYKRR